MKMDGVSPTLGHTWGVEQKTDVNAQLAGDEAAAAAAVMPLALDGDVSLHHCALCDPAN